MPRCISLSYGTIHLYFPGIDQFWFSVGACLVIFAATFRKSRVVDLLGEILAPLLVLCLSVIIIKGLYVHPASPAVVATARDMFMYGILEGYNTMDLLGTFFFSSITIASLKSHFPKERDPNVLAGFALKASLIGAGLLGGVYVGFALIASYYGNLLVGLRPEILLGTLAHVLLGSAGGFFVSMAVALACLTTAVTLAAVFAEFIQRQSGFYHLGYTYCLVLTLIVTCAFANLGFSGIVGLMAPVLVVGYPGLLMLVVVNALHKTHGLRMVKAPVALTALASFVHHNWAWFAPFFGA
jgi:LIVCS family branched-chain amino acid:cation transporter